jgi:hypothetical protein
VGVNVISVNYSPLLQQHMPEQQAHSSQSQSLQSWQQLQKPPSLAQQQPSQQPLHRPIVVHPPPQLQQLLPPANSEMPIIARNPNTGMAYIHHFWVAPASGQQIGVCGVDAAAAGPATGRVAACLAAVANHDGRIPNFACTTGCHAYGDHSWN